jgi:hypothetical protein
MAKAGNPCFGKAASIMRKTHLALQKIIRFNFSGK